jgi:hypothetical protein
MRFYIAYYFRLTFSYKYDELERGSIMKKRVEELRDDSQLPRQEGNRSCRWVDGEGEESDSIMSTPELLEASEDGTNVLGWDEIASVTGSFLTDLVSKEENYCGRSLSSESGLGLPVDTVIQAAATM